jgi:hypothetical protein
LYQLPVATTPFFLTSNGTPGEVVPIPTFPLLSIRIVSVPDDWNVKIPSLPPVDFSPEVPLDTPLSLFNVDGMVYSF